VVKSKNTENKSIFSIYHVHAVHRCGLLLQMSQVVWIVCLCVLTTRVICVKTAELIQMSFGRLTHVGSRNHVLDPPREGTLLRPDVAAHCSSMNACCIVRLPVHVAIKHLPSPG